jgi:superfamily II DNA or RNA helicase
MQLRPHQVRILERMQTYPKGQIIVPTGGGKTMCMIQDTAHVQQSKCGHTTVVVAPRILLAEQLCSEFLEVITSTYTHVMHVHSGETHHFSTTNSEKIHVFANTARNMGEDCIIFTTYHSLHRVVDADIEVNTIYFDEAHNSVQRNFFGPTEHFAAESDRCYFFTATPKHSLTIKKPGMNDTAVYGQVLVNVPAPELVEGGYILPPKVVVKQLDMVQDKMKIWSRDCDFLMQTIDDQETEKVLVCARTTKQIIGLLTDSDFALECAKRGMSWMTITSKTGAIIDGQKVNREVFFDTLNAWGKDPSKKFVVLHHSILSEGINVNGLESVVFLRNMDYIGISQSIGRVIRLGDTSKTFGLVCVPVYDSVGITTSRKVQAVVDTVFEQGQPAISEIRR